MLRILLINILILITIMLIFFGNPLKNQSAYTKDYLKTLMFFLSWELIIIVILQQINPFGKDTKKMKRYHKQKRTINPPLISIAILILCAGCILLSIDNTLLKIQFPIFVPILLMITSIPLLILGVRNKFFRKKLQKDSRRYSFS
ncbi:MAG: hypothetical protein ACTSRP_05280 [Candidatus Helarchaeota archaeon]